MSHKHQNDATIIFYINCVYEKYSNTFPQLYAWRTIPYSANDVCICTLNPRITLDFNQYIRLTITSHPPHILYVNINIERSRSYANIFLWRLIIEQVSKTPLQRTIDNPHLCLGTYTFLHRLLPTHNSQSGCLNLYTNALVSRLFTAVIFVTKHDKSINTIRKTWSVSVWGEH